jgi:hypothetical protein
LALTSPPHDEERQNQPDHDDGEAHLPEVHLQPRLEPLDLAEIVFDFDARRSDEQHPQSVSKAISPITIPKMIQARLSNVIPPSLL